MEDDVDGTYNAHGGGGMVVINLYENG